MKMIKYIMLLVFGLNNILASSLKITPRELRLMQGVSSIVHDMTNEDLELTNKFINRFLITSPLDSKIRVFSTIPVAEQANSLREELILRHADTIREYREGKMLESEADIRDRAFTHELNALTLAQYTAPQLMDMFFKDFIDEKLQDNNYLELDTLKISQRELMLMQCVEPSLQCITNEGLEVANKFIESFLTKNGRVSSVPREDEIRRAEDELIIRQADIIKECQDGKISESEAEIRKRALIGEMQALRFARMMVPVLLKMFLDYHYENSRVIVRRSDQLQEDIKK